jgi:CheY-like chemotaxis protein
MSSPTILIVEDEAIVSLDISIKLRNMGYGIAGSIDSGEKAVTLARQLRPSLVLMDIRLIGSMDGIAAADANCWECQIPVVFLTAQSRKSISDRTRQMETFGHVKKPFEDCELRAQIEMALRKNTAGRL